ncbi:transposon-transfer assisting family protein [Listeria seeligeri]|uniref:transposon-transfer assisting family protein n=1 Tax=Listeria seeligeri TaxID=1640 RepID=UPI0031CC77B7
MNLFTIEEQHLICIFDTFTRAHLLTDMRICLPYIENNELKSIMLDVIKKIEMIDDGIFDVLPLDFANYYNKEME